MSEAVREKTYDLEVIRDYEGRTENRCPRHPKYEPTERPRTPCVACWDVYINLLYVERMGS